MKNSEKVILVSIFDLKVSGKNELLYHPIHEDDPEIIDLANSIREHGLKEDFVISEDGYIISGHKRRLACIRAGLFQVRCKVEPITEGDPKFLVLLRECNRQRIKGIDEIIREEVLDATNNEKEIAKRLKSERIKKSLVSISPMEIRGSKRRYEIKGRRTLLDAAIKILLELQKEGFLPTTARTIHYELLNDPPLVCSGKTKRYTNDEVDSKGKRKRGCYQALCDVLTRARLSEEIPWDWIADETRPRVVWTVYQNTSKFIQDQFKGFMKGYYRDLLQSQPNCIEIIGEKGTLETLVRPIASKYTIPYSLGKGFDSVLPRHEVAERFKQSGKQKLIILILSDFDPDGAEIAMSYARSMRDDFHIETVYPIHVCLTYEQVKDLSLPRGGMAKKSSKNYKKFVNLYGEYIFELEALRPKLRQELLVKAIESVLDIDAFNHEVEQEEIDFLKLAQVRKTAMNSLKSMK